MAGNHETRSCVASSERVLTNSVERCRGRSIVKIFGSPLCVVEFPIVMTGVIGGDCGRVSLFCRDMMTT